MANTAIASPGAPVPIPKVLFMMADYGHDPTGAQHTRRPSVPLAFLYSNPVYPETAVPYTAFKNEGYNIKFATENGKSPRCDKKMLEGFTQKLLVRHDGL